MFGVAMALLYLSPSLAIMKWKTLVDCYNPRVPYNSLKDFFFKSLFLGVITPGKLGELWKAKYLSDKGDISLGNAFFTVAMDRLIDIIVMALVAIVGIIMLLTDKTKAQWAAIILILLLIISAVYFLFKKEKLIKAIRFLFSYFPKKLKDKINPHLDDFLDGIEKIKFLLFLKLLAYGFAYYFLTVLIYYFLAMSLGIYMSFPALFMIVAVVMMIMLLPLTVFGLGTREAGYIFFFSLYGISASLALAFSLFVLLTGIILSIPGMILFLRKK